MFIGFNDDDLIGFIKGFVRSPFWNMVGFSCLDRLHFPIDEDAEHTFLYGERFIEIIMDVFWRTRSVWLYFKVYIQPFTIL